MQSRTRVIRGSLTLGVMLLVAVAGIFGPSAQAQTVPSALPAPSELQIAEPAAGESVKPPSSVPPPRQVELHRATRPQLSNEFAAEVEPNGTPATATPLTFNGGGYLQMQGNVSPIADVDWFSFSAQAGDRIYAAAMTAATASTSNDAQLRVFASDGTTLIEFDDDDGSLANLSPTIAGATLPTAGTYYLQVKHFDDTNSIRPYFLHVELQSGAPTPEVEPNDTPGTANPLPANGWVSGTRNPAAATEQDWYSFTANAGDTVFLSLDADPERDNVQWDGRLGIALFGDASNQILVVNDTSTGTAANPLSEALFMTVKTSGTYFAFVDSASAAAGGPTATYTLSVSIAPPPAPEPNCTTYTSTDVPKTIGPANGLVSSTITVPGNPLITDVDVEVVLNHALMQDIDAHLRSPAGNDIGLFTDIGAAATGGQQQMDLVFDDEAAIIPTFTVLKGLKLKPESTYRLSWLDGENAGGTWTLDLNDDTAGANGGALTAWSLRICAAPPPPACPPGFGAQTVYTTDFESGAAGFTHNGTQDEWELGLPATVATTTANPVAGFATCASGVNCWKTDLDNTYNASSAQDLISPAINLAGLSAPVIVSWSQRYQMETASNDRYNVNYRQVGGPTSLRVFEWLDGTMVDTVGNPAVNIGASAGWGRVSARADALAGLNTELLFHVDSNATLNFGGVAIDDVSVTACRALSADLSITKTDGVTTATPGGSVTYTITAANAGPDPATSVTVADTFPAIETCTWTCVGAGGGTCTAAGAGNINDATNLPAGGSVTYTASCAINASASGTLSNTATVSSSITDPNPANNSATDTDTLTPSANLGITKTDGVTTATPGGSVTYTITASNAGPSNAPGATVADTFPASLTCTWTCVGAGGGTCTASGSGNINDTVNLPAGGSVTHTASCTVSAAASGSLSNTATVTAPAGVTDPAPGNNSATDNDTLAASADLSITKTDGVTTATPGGSVTYTITASNAGPSNAPGATVADTFPASLTCTWTCVGAGGGTCTASGSGNINDTVNLPAGGSVTHTASCAVSAAASGTLANTATVAAPPGVADPTPGNNSATDTDTLAASADLAITKTDGVVSVTAGGTTTYTITASNAGPSNATGATVTDTFPASLTCTWTCVGAGGGTCTASGSGNISGTVNLPAGGSVTYTASCGISGAATGSLSNTATVAAPAGVTDPTPGNNSATDTDTILVPSAVSGTKTVTGTFASGGTVTYTVVLSNTGGAQGNNPGNEFSDILPTQLTLVSASASSGTAAATVGTNTVTWNGAIASTGSVTITIVATVNASASGTVSNQGSISYDSNGDGTNDASAVTDDPTTGAPNDPTVFTITPTADLSITKTDGSATVVAGGSTTYTIVASNAGPNAVTGASVQDSFPASLACSWTCAGSGGGSCTASGSGNINDTAVNLPSAASATYTAVCAIGAAATGTLSNTASVAAPAGTNDTNTANNSATDTSTILVPAAISGTKTVSGTFLPGGTVTYTVTLGNAGGSQTDNPGDEFTDLLPATLSLVSASASSGTAIANAGTNTVTWNGPFAAAGSVTITITATIGAGATGTISNQGSFAYDSDANGSNDRNGVTDDPGTAVANDPTSFALGTSADLTVSKTDGVASVQAGTSSTYTISVGNLGPSAIVGATVTDTFPAECTAPTWTCTVSGGGSCPASGSGSIAATVDLPVSAIATFTATCAVDVGVAAGTVITNTATAAVPAGASDPDPANNAATDSTTVTSAPNATVSGSKSAAGVFVVGGTVTYTIVLNNSGAGTQGDNPGDEFVDALPSQLTLVSATASSGTAVANIGTNSVSWNGSIAAGGSVTLTITATIDAGASGNISNQGQIFFDNDANGTNNATVTTDDPAVGGPADATVFAVLGGPATPPVPVPGLTPFGLALLAAALALAGLRRRRYR